MDYMYFTYFNLLTFNSAQGGMGYLLVSSPTFDGLPMFHYIKYCTECPVQLAGQVYTILSFSLSYFLPFSLASLLPRSLSSFLPFSLASSLPRFLAPSLSLS